MKGVESVQIKNSYIFLPKENNRSKHEKTISNVIHIKLGQSVQNILKQNFNINSESINNNEFFKTEIKTIVRVAGFDFEVSFIINCVDDNTYLDVITSHNSKDRIIICLEYINSIISGSNFEKHFIVIVSYDAISEYYCNKMYPRLNELERTLRKLLFNIYIVNFGKAYYTKTVKPELQSKVKGIVQAKGNVEKKEIEYLKMFFYSLEYADIQTMLFESRWTSLEEQQKNDFLNKHSNLAELGDEQLRKVFDSISPKSDWDRFFKDKISDIDVKALLNNIRSNRNSIAHCKFFHKNEYQACAKSISKLKKAINKAIILTEEKDFTQKNTERLKGAISGLSIVAAQFQKTISEIVEPMAQTMAEMVKIYSIPLQNMVQSINLSAAMSQLSTSLYQNTKHFLNGATKDIFPEENPNCGPNKEIND